MISQSLAIAYAIWTHPANVGGRVRALARAVRWQIHKRLFRRPIDIPFHGRRLLCWPDSNAASAALYFNGLPDYREMTFMQAYLRPGDHFIDVGANVGVYSVLAVGCVGYEGSVDAFEPLEKSAQRIEAQAALNNLANLRVHRFVVCDHGGTVEFGFSRNDSMMRMRSAGETSHGAHLVSCIRLDDFNREKRYAMGKMDIEGAEPLALKGAEGRLAEANPPVWLLELAGYSQSYGFTSDQVLDLLKSFDYDCAIYDPDARRLVYTDQPWNHGVQNILAISKAHAADVAARIRSGTI